jgi:hypothetical protein
MGGAGFAQAGRAHLLADLDEHLDVEPQASTLPQNQIEGRQVDGVLALVVRCTAAVPPLSFDGERPGL